MNEYKFYASIRPQLLKLGHPTRIENHATPGIADVSFAASGREAWLELKVEKSGKLYFENTQIVWAKKRLEHFPRVWCLWLSESETEVCCTRMSQVLTAPHQYFKGKTVVSTSDTLNYRWPRRSTSIWPQIIEKIMSVD